MNSRQLETVEQAKIVAALRTQGALIGENRELCHALARELVQGYVFVVVDDSDAAQLRALIENPVGSTGNDAQTDTNARTFQTDLLEDR